MLHTHFYKYVYCDYIHIYAAIEYTNKLNKTNYNEYKFKISFLPLRSNINNSTAFYTQF